MEHLVDYSCSR